MNRLVSLIILAATCCAVYAQDILPQIKRERPDMDQIRREVTDRNSPYYYPKLMEEFQRNDTLDRKSVV